MSSEEYYYPRRASPCDGLRRSKRLTTLESQQPRSKILRKNNDKPATKKSAMRKKLAKTTKQKLGEIPNEKESWCTFSGEPLNDEELRQLFVKFSNDGHFRNNPSGTSSYPLVISRSTDGKVITTKNNRHRDVTATVTSQRGNMEDDDDKKKGFSLNTTNSKSVTFSNPLPHASGSTLRISTSKVQYLPTNRDNVWSGSTICRNFLSSGSFRAGNVMTNVPFNGNSLSHLAPPVKQQYPFITNSTRFDQIFTDSNSSRGWKLFEQRNGQLENRNETNSGGIHYPGNNSLVEHSGNITNTQTSRFNHENIVNNDFYDNTTNNGKLPSMPNRQNNPCAKFNTTGITTPNSFQSAWGNSASNWNADEIPLNTFAILNPSGNSIDSQNSTNYVSSSVVPEYNSAEKNATNNCTYGIPENGNATIVENANSSGHNSSFVAWNNADIFPNSSATGSEMSYGDNNYSCPISSVECAAPTFINDPSNFNNQTNYTSHNNSSNKGFFVMNGNETNSSIITNILTNATATTTTTNASMAMNNGDTNKTVFLLEDFANSQNGNLCPALPSICPYDDDIGYENYIDGNLIYNENSMLTTTVNNELTASLLTKIKAEIRPLRDAPNNYSHNVSRLHSDSSTFYDFDTKKELTNSPDCVILDDTSDA